MGGGGVETQGIKLIIGLAAVPMDKKVNLFPNHHANIKRIRFIFICLYFLIFSVIWKLSRTSGGSI